MKVIELNVNEIKILENIRTRIDMADLAPLMESIKQHGLFHPVGTWKEKDEYILAWGHRRLTAYKKLGFKKIPAVILPEKLSEEDFITKNTSENAHRSNISPLELGRNCKRLRDIGLSVSEIATRLSIPKSRVTNCLHIHQRLPQEYEGVIGYISGNAPKRGKISAVVAGRILSFRTTKKSIEELLKYAKREELTIQQLALLDTFFRAGLSTKEALKNLEKYRTYNVKFAVDKEENKKFKTNLFEYIFEIVEGKRKPHPGLIFYKRLSKKEE